ncbi:MAG: UbiA family prenyltransferase [Thermoproteota archaeon]
MRDTGLRDYLELSRPYTLLAPAVGGFVFSWWGSLDSGSSFSAAFPKILLVCMTLAMANYVGNVINQVFDREIDSDSPAKRNRPIPSGRVSVDGAMSFAWVLTLSSASFSFVLIGSFYGILFSTILIFTWLYSSPPLRLRSKLFLSNLSIAFPRGGLGVLTAYSSFNNPLSNQYLLMVSLTLGVFVFFTNTLKDFEDKEVDARYGVRNFVTVFGDKASSILVMFGFVAVPLILSSTYGFLYAPPSWFSSSLVVVSVTSIIAVVATFIWTRFRDSYGWKMDRLMWRVFYGYFLLLIIALTPAWNALLEQLTFL